MNNEEFAKLEPRFDLGTALSHLGAYFSGGDELGEVSQVDAEDAFGSVMIHTARMQIAIDAADQAFGGVDFSLANTATIAAAGICAELSSHPTGAL